MTGLEGCCACAAHDKAAAATPISVSNLRRLIASPEAQDKASYRSELGDWKWQPMSALGQKQTFAMQQPMSALPRKADMCSANARVCYGPKADSCNAAKGRYSIISSARACIDGGTLMPSALAVLRLMTSSNFVACTTGNSAGFSPLRTLPT